jgi:FkbM family methyltransferase
VLPDPLVTALRPLRWPGKRRFMECFSPHHGLRRAHIAGASFQLDLSEYIQRQLYQGTFELAETRLVHRYLRHGMTFVDGGANVGYFTALAARCVGSTGRVIAYEPSPQASLQLHQLIAANRWTFVEAVPSGLGARADELTLYWNPSSGNHTPTLVPHAASSQVKVEIRTLDAEAARLGLDRIDFLKLDVEGHEPHVLAGAQRLLAERRIGAILCEFNQPWLSAAGSSCAALDAQFRAAGLRLQPLSLGDNRFYTS